MLKEDLDNACSYPFVLGTPMRSMDSESIILMGPFYFDTFHDSTTKNYLWVINILKNPPHIYTIIRKRECKEAIGKLRAKYFIDKRAWRSNCFLLSLTESCKRLFSRCAPQKFSSSHLYRFLFAQSQLSFSLNKAHPGVIVSVMIPMVFWREFNAKNYRVFVTLPSSTFETCIICFICLNRFFHTHINIFL